MSASAGNRNPDARGPGVRLAAIVAVVALLAAGVGVTATADPGPATDVKTAQYGGGPTKPPPTSGPCKGIGGEALQGCQTNAKAQYKKAKAKCAHKKTKAKRAKCRKAAKKKWVG
jgi:hypothetical protein